MRHDDDDDTNKAQASVVVFYMLQVCDHIEHVVVLVALHSCH